MLLPLVGQAVLGPQVARSSAAGKQSASPACVLQDFLSAYAKEIRSRLQACGEKPTRESVPVITLALYTNQTQLLLTNGIAPAF